jgi:type 1 glutamine amidotransferase
MLKTLLPTTLLLVVFGIAIAADDKPAKAPAPLKVLLVAGGCCHDYPGQSEVLKAGIESIINAEVTVDFNPDTSTEATFARYESADWADEFDVIIHDECSANVTDPDYVNRILDAHRGGVPAVNLHCGMHSYRWGEFREPVESGADNAGWYEMIGIQSSSHGPKAPIDVTFTDKKHPITVGMKDWTTIDEELYNNVQVFESGKGLASGSQMQMPKKKKGEKADPNAKPAEATAIVAWTNEYGPKKTKIFSTTLGHFTETVADDRYLDLVTRGILWTTGKIEDDGTPAEGYGN